MREWWGSPAGQAAASRLEAWATRETCAGGGSGGRTGGGSSSPTPDYLPCLMLRAIDVDHALREWGSPPLLVRLLLFAFDPRRVVSSTMVEYRLSDGGTVLLGIEEPAPVQAVDLRYIHGSETRPEIVWEHFEADDLLERFLRRYYGAGKPGERSQARFLERAVYDFARHLARSRGLG